MPKLKAHNFQFDDKEQLLNGEMETSKSCDNSNDKPYIPDSILKQSTSKSKSYKSSSSSGVKPNIIMSLEDRDIVVIDHADYKESIGNESEVIVVEKPRMPPNDIDLADLLGSNWPSIAGDSALALNNARANAGGHYNLSSGSTSSTSSSNYQLSSSSAQNATITERNKSRNPLSHFGQSKVKRNTHNSFHLDSNGSGSSNESSVSSKCSLFVYVLQLLWAMNSATAVISEHHTLPIDQLVLFIDFVNVCLACVAEPRHATTSAIYQW